MKSSCLKHAVLYIMGFRLRRKAKISSSVELTGDEEPVNKLLNPSQLHVSDSFRSSALSVFSLPQVPSHSSTPSSFLPYLPHVASIQDIRMQHQSPQSLHTSFYSPSQSPMPVPEKRSISNPRTKLVLPKEATGLGYPPTQEKRELPSFRMRLKQARDALNVRLPDKPVVRRSPFVPYTYQDYVKVKDRGNARLGGLGPANVDSEAWIEKTKLRVQATMYAKMAHARNEQKGR